jgi:hypothetical protein
VEEGVGGGGGHGDGGGAERSGVWDGPNCGVAVILLVFSRGRCPLSCPVLPVWNAMTSDPSIALAQKQSHHGHRCR